MTHYNDPMEQPAPAGDPELSAADLRTCVRVLGAIVRDRALLTRLTQEERRELISLAGRVAKPDRQELVRMAKAFRRADRAAARASDRAAIERAGLRIQRRAEVYAPLWLAPPGSEESTGGDGLHDEIACYVCKRPYRTVHRYYDSLCPECGDFNYAKRGQTADLSGN